MEFQRERRGDRNLLSATATAECVLAVCLWRLKRGLLGSEREARQESAVVVGWTSFFWPTGQGPTVVLSFFFAVEQLVAYVLQIANTKINTQRAATRLQLMLRSAF